MLFLPVLASLVQLIAFSAATPRSEDTDSDRFQTTKRQSTRYDVSLQNGSRPGPPADRAEIAGVLRGSWMVNNDEELLVIINDLKGQQLVRQSACFRTHQQERPTSFFMVRRSTG